MADAQESLLLNRDIFKDETSLELLFNKFIKLPDIELGCIRNQHTSSNDKWHKMFYYNMNEILERQFKTFCKSFGFYKIGDYVFYSHPFCPCNNPATVYIKKAMELSLFKEEKRFIEWFNKKEFNDSHFPEMKWCRLSTKEIPINKSFFETMWDYIESKDVFKDSENNYYTPFNICDSLIYDGGCSCPGDSGYVMQQPFNFKV